MKNKIFLMSIHSFFALVCLCQFSFTNADDLLAQKDGISVTLEVSTPNLVADLVNDPRSQEFKVPFNTAVERSNIGEGNFIDLFVAEFEKLNEGVALTKHFFFYDRQGISRKSSNAQVLTWLKSKASDALNETGRIIEKRAHKFGLSKPNIAYHYQLNQIIIELPGINDNQIVRHHIKASANLGFYEIYDNGMMGISGVILQGEPALSKALFGEELKSNDTGSETADVLLSEDDIAKDYPISSLLNLAFRFDETGQIVDYQEGSIVGYAKIKDTAELNLRLNHPVMRINLPQDLEFMWDYKEIMEYGEQTGTVALHAIKVPLNGPKVDDNDIKKAFVNDQIVGEFGVNIEMNDNGARKWENMTSENLNRQIAMITNKSVLSAPVVNGVMDKNSSITGNFTLTEAKDLADLINAGSYPAPVKIVQIDKLK
ncbi:MAG: SecD/SecF fusion protein [Crocinitomix sp.]|jgi:SecD/SecF fusion protein